MSITQGGGDHGRPARTGMSVAADVGFFHHIDIGDLGFGFPKARLFKS